MDMRPRFLVVGLGAVGGLIARSLVSGGAEVIGVDPDPGCGGPGFARRDPEELRPGDFEGVDAVVLATRATIARAALLPVRSDLPVVAVHNGFHPALGRGRSGPSLRGVVDFAASRRGSELVCTRPGTIYLERAAATERLASSFGPGPVRPALAREIEPHLWSKLLFNASLDPVAALEGRTLGGVLSERRTFLVFRELFLEGCRVVRALGIRPARVQGTDPLRLARLLSTPLLDRLVGRIAGSRAAAIESTMLADLAAGRPTEIEFLNGHLVREAERAGVEVPAHRRLLALFDEEGRRARYTTSIASP